MITGPFPPNTQTIPYSQALNTLQQDATRRAGLQSALLKEVTLIETPEAPLSQAKLTYQTGFQTAVDLPNSPKDPFRKLLTTSGVAYSYALPTPNWRQKWHDISHTVVHETLMPLLVFGATTLPMVLLFQRGQTWMARQEVESLLRRSVKTFRSEGQPLNKLLELHTPEVQARSQAFLKGELDALVAEGPPGTGKTNLLKNLARTSQQQRGSLILDIGGPKGEVRQLLLELYSGDEVKSRSALKTLSKLQRSCKELIVFVDEMEQFTEDLEPLILKGLGNGGDAKLPRLRLLGTCNQLPAFEDAAKNRVNRGRLYIDHPSPEATSRVVAQLMPGTPAPALKPLFEQHPGYSLRSLVDLAKAAAQEPNPVKSLAGRLADTPLDDSEMAGSLRRFALQQLEKTQGPLHPAAQNMLHLSSTQPAETATAGLDRMLRVNAEGFQQLLTKAFEKVPLSPTPDDFNEALSIATRNIRDQAPAYLSQSSL
jgi:hypothetical protein